MTNLEKLKRKKAKTNIDFKPFFENLDKPLAEYSTYDVLKAFYEWLNSEAE